MTRDEFKQKLFLDLKRSLPEHMNVARREIEKNNGVVMDALQFTNTQYPYAPQPIIYMNHLYDRWIDLDENYELVLEQLMENKAWEKQYASFGAIIQEFPEDKIFMRVVNLERNQNLIGKVPCMQEENLLITYRVLASKDEQGIASFLIDEKLRNQYGISLEQLHKIAMENTPKLFPLKFNSLENFIFQNDQESRSKIKLENAEEKEQLFYLTNEEKLNGASVLFYPGVREALEEAFPEGYYVLPSSIHEVLIASTSIGLEEDELSEMVQGVNQETVDDVDILSDRAFKVKAPDKGLNPLPAPEEKLEAGESKWKEEPKLEIPQYMEVEEELELEMSD
jgi:hypothetical protein